MIGKKVPWAEGLDYYSLVAKLRTTPSVTECVRQGKMRICFKTETGTWFFIYDDGDHWIYGNHNGHASFEGVF